MEEKSSSSRPSKLHRHFYFDHKNVDTLRHFINPFGQIEVRHRSMSNHQKTNLREMQQKSLSRAIKRARFLALLPYIDNQAA